MNICCHYLLFPSEQFIENLHVAFLWTVSIDTRGRTCRVIHFGIVLIISRGVGGGRVILVSVLFAWCYSVCAFSLTNSRVKL